MDFVSFAAYLQPFLDEISLVADFSIKSQWLYLLPLNVRPKEVYDSSVLGRHFAFSEDILPQLITPLEKKLGTVRFGIFLILTIFDLLECLTN